MAKRCGYKIRKHIYWYTKGLPGCASFHSKLSGLKDKRRPYSRRSIPISISFKGGSPCQSFASAESRSLLDRKKKRLGGEGSRPLHPWSRGRSSIRWNYQKAFFERQFSPIIIELPGHGKSGGEGEQEIGRYAEDVYAFLKTVGLSRKTLVGHSMGGAIVQTLALTHPEVIQRIVLVGTGARLRVSSRDSEWHSARTLKETVPKDCSNLPTLEKLRRI